MKEEQAAGEDESTLPTAFKLDPQFASTDCIRKLPILLVTRRSRLYKQDYLFMPRKSIKQD